MKKFIFTLSVYLLLLNTITAQSAYRAGINFPFRNPETASIAVFMDRLKETGTPMMRQMTFADVYWKQVEPADDQWDFTLADSAYFNPFGIMPVGELFAIMGAEDTVGIQVPWEACANPMFCFWDPETDSAETKDYIFTVIDRYKPVTTYWEIANEFNNVMPPAGLPLPQKLNFLQYCHDWIRQADNTATVVFPGMVGTYGFPMENNYSWLRNFLDMGGGSTFDVMNYHDYNSWWTLPAHYDSLRGIMDDMGCADKGLWITETSISSDTVSSITPAYSSVDEQAADVWRRMALLWAKGADAVFWHSFWSSGLASDWGEFGLLNSLGKKKKSFHAFRLLIDKVASFEEAEALEYGEITHDNENGGDGIWVIKFVVGDQPKWLLWSPDNQPYVLEDIGAQHIAVTHVVPEVLLQNGDSAVFQIDTAATVNGNYLFENLTSLPVLVERTIVQNVDERDNKTQLSIFPNPATDRIRLMPCLSNPEAINIYNLQGAGVTGLTTISGYSSTEISIDISALESGTYILKTENESLLFYKSGGVGK